MTERLARWLVQLYPRVWRARYEEEFFALLDESAISWRTVLDVAMGAISERARQAARLALGESWDSLSDGTKNALCFVAGALISAVSWIAGLWLDPFVPDGFTVISPFFTAVMIREWLPRLGTLAPAPPVYVANPFKPGRVFRLRVPSWWPKILRLPRLPVGWVMPVSTTGLALAWVLAAASPTRPFFHGVMWGVMVTLYWCNLAMAPRAIRMPAPPPGSESGG